MLKVRIPRPNASRLKLAKSIQSSVDESRIRSSARATSHHVEKGVMYRIHHERED